MTGAAHFIAPLCVFAVTGVLPLIVRTVISAVSAPPLAARRSDRSFAPVARTVTARAVYGFSVTILPTFTVRPRTLNAPSPARGRRGRRAPAP